MQLTPLPAFNDNYLWLWHDSTRAVVVDPGDGEVVMQALSRLQLHLDAILVTHHHADHIGGVNVLRQATQAVVYGPAGENIPGPYVALTGGDTFVWQGQRIEVIDVPGHTAGHNCYWVEDLRILFTGDNILGVGTSAIGPPPAGDMQQYLDSLLRMRDLQATLFAPGHGPTVTATDAKVQELLDHRATRDRQIIDLIDKGYTTDLQIRRGLYPEIQKGLRRAAGGQIRAHLAKMVGQGIATVTQEDEGKVWRVALTK